VTDTQDAADWTRERITYSGAGGEQAIAYLYLPRRAARPLQVIHYVPSDSVIYGLTVPEEVEALAPPLIRAGRAVFAVVNKGFTERRFPAPYAPPDQATVRYREVLVNRSVDLQRGLDYLATRPEIDMSRLAGWGTSIWSAELVPFAVEQRYRAIVLLAAGIPRTEITVAPEANAVNFVSRFGAPTLMLVGRHDESISYEAEAEPLFKLLPAPKSLRLFDGGHIPPVSMWIPVLADWLNARLGPVKGP
jgi:pimeloyl-ACP methyl ester carboxylesterase